MGELTNDEGSVSFGSGDDGLQVLDGVPGLSGVQNSGSAIVGEKFDQCFEWLTLLLSMIMFLAASRPSRSIGMLLKMRVPSCQYPT
jgi:hypothetical protein